MDNKIKILLDNGFKPMFDTADNTLYVKGKFVVSSTAFSEEELSRAIGNTPPGSRAEEPKAEPEAARKEEAPVGERADAGGSDDPLVEYEGGEVEEEADDEEENVFVEHSEPVDAFYLAEIVKTVEVPVFRRLTIGGNRYYYRTMDDGTVKIYASATNLIKDGYADDKTGLNEWKMQMKFLGHNPEEVSGYEADKGTIMHYLYDQYLTGRDIYLRKAFIREMVSSSDVRISKKNMERFLSSDEDLENMMDRLRRFAKFCSDYKVVPIMIEKVLSYDEYNVASPIDLVCLMTVTETEEGYFGETYKKDTKEHKKGDPKLSKRTVERSFYAIVDFKSGGIYPSHSLQLELYRRAVTQWYGDLIPIEKIYNFSPKSDSGKEYVLRDQTGCKELRKADVVYAQGAINHENKDKRVRMLRGCLNINKEFKNEDYVIDYDIAEELRKLNEREKKA